MGGGEITPKTRGITLNYINLENPLCSSILAFVIASSASLGLSNKPKYFCLPFTVMLPCHLLRPLWKATPLIPEVLLILTLRLHPFSWLLQALRFSILLFDGLPSIWSLRCCRSGIDRLVDVLGGGTC